MASVEQNVQQLMQPMLKKLLFVVIARVTGTQEEMKPHVAEHLEWMNRMEAEGKLFASGPLIRPGRQRRSARSDGRPGYASSHPAPKPTNCHGGVCPNPR